MTFWDVSLSVQWIYTCSIGGGLKALSNSTVKENASESRKGRTGWCIRRFLISVFVNQLEKYLTSHVGKDSSRRGSKPSAVAFRCLLKQQHPPDRGWDVLPGRSGECGTLPRLFSHTPFSLSSSREVYREND